MFIIFIVRMYVILIWIISTSSIVHTAMGFSVLCVVMLLVFVVVSFLVLVRILVVARIRVPVHVVFVLVVAVAAVDAFVLLML